MRALPRPAPPVAIIARLTEAYRATVGQWREVLEREVLETWDRNPYAFGPGGLLVRDSRFTQNAADKAARAMATAPAQAIAEAGARVDAKSREDFKRIIVEAKGAQPKGRQFGTKTYVRKLKVIGLEPHTASRIASFREASLQRITSLRDDQIASVRDLLEEGEREGWHADEVRRRMVKDLDVTQSKADLIARDQTLKLAADVTKERQTQSGIRQYIWRTSRDERVRGTPGGKWPRGMHYDLEGTLQSWDDPPVTNEAGDTNHPGQDYQCRCTPEPVLPDIADLEDFEQ